MRVETRRSVRSGVVYGLLVGLFFAILEMMGSSAMGQPALAPWRAFASTILGRQALTTTPIGVTFVAGVIAHFALSAIYGVVYALGIGKLPEETRRSWTYEVGIGLAFGVALYVLNFHIIARLAYPWFLSANQTWQFILHTIFFGLPLALCFASSERKTGGQYLVG